MRFILRCSLHVSCARAVLPAATGLAAPLFSFGCSHRRKGSLGNPGTLTQVKRTVALHALHTSTIRRHTHATHAAGRRWGHNEERDTQLTRDSEEEEDAKVGI